jgi:hypothetical protein
MWVHILDLPFGWTNANRGSHAAGLIGEVLKIDTDVEGKAYGAFIRARVLVDMSKPLRRGIMLKKDKSSSPPEWFAIQYENLPFLCFSCGLIGHLEKSCPDPQPKDADGKLPYELKRLRAPRDIRRRAQSFAQAAVESFGNSSGSRKSGASFSSMFKAQGIGKGIANGHSREDGVPSADLLNASAGVGMHRSGKEKIGEKMVMIQVPRKRKGPNSKSQEPGHLVPDLNGPVMEGQGSKQMVLCDTQHYLSKGELEVQKKQRLDKISDA